MKDQTGTLTHFVFSQCLSLGFEMIHKILVLSYRVFIHADFLACNMRASRFGLFNINRFGTKESISSFIQLIRQ